MQVNEPPPLPLSLLATPVSHPTHLHLLPTPGFPHGLLPPGWPAASHSARRSSPGVFARVSKLAALSSYEGLGWVFWEAFFSFNMRILSFHHMSDVTWNSCHVERTGLSTSITPKKEKTKEEKYTPVSLSPQAEQLNLSSAINQGPRKTCSTKDRWSFAKEWTPLKTSLLFFKTKSCLLTVSLMQHKF